MLFSAPLAIRHSVGVALDFLFRLPLVPRLHRKACLVILGVTQIAIAGSIILSTIIFAILLLFIFFEIFHRALLFVRVRIVVEQARLQAGILYHELDALLVLRHVQLHLLEREHDLLALHELQ